MAIDSAPRISVPSAPSVEYWVVGFCTASASNIESSAENGTPSADQKYHASEPGIVLISFTNTSSPTRRKSMRATDRTRAAATTARAASLISVAMASGSAAGSSRLALAMPSPPRYLSA